MLWKLKAGVAGWIRTRNTSVRSRRCRSTTGYPYLVSAQECGFPWCDMNDAYYSAISAIHIAFWITRAMHCTTGISTAATHIGSSCACRGGRGGRFGLVLVHVTAWARPTKTTSGHPPKINHTSVSLCRHCDGEMVSTNGHLARPTYSPTLIEWSKLFTQCVYKMLKGWCFTT